MENIKRGSWSETVSDESEALILVDSDDRVVGQLDKYSCHEGAGTLHRAFSLFVFNDRGELLLQQRAADKRLWPNHWSNSCCSHPRVGEEMDEAIQRRCRQELGFATALEFLYKFEYQAHYADVGSEHELCSVYVGAYAGEPDVNTSEIQAWRWISRSELTAELSRNPDQFTPWLQLEWRELAERFSDQLPVS